MQEAQIERRKMVTLPQEEFEAILERAAERGARHALSDVGLDGPEAARDISELRSLLDAFNEAKKTAWLTIVRMLVTGLVMATLAGAFVKLKVLNAREIGANGAAPDRERSVSRRGAALARVEVH